MRQGIAIVVAMLVLLAVGCRQHKETVVSVSPMFNVEETWRLMTIQGREPVYAEGQKKITLIINPDAGTFSGTDGCNRYFGTFKSSGDGTMKLSDFNATKKACPETFGRLSGNYRQLLMRCNAYKLGEYELELMQGDKTLLTFEKEGR